MKKRYLIDERERIWLLRTVCVVLAISVGYWGILSFVRLFSTGMSVDYNDISTSVSTGRITGLLVYADKTENFYVMVGDAPKPLGDLTTDDLESLGFVQKNFAYVKAPTSPHFSLVRLGQNGKARSLNLSHVKTAGVPFSSSPNGPFLELPVSRHEFEKQFGKPTKVKYLYPKGWDPR
jgi:hypothetical protein